MPLWLLNPRTIAAAALVVAVGASYWKGRADCGAIQKARLEAAAEAARQTETQAADEAYKRGLADAAREGRRNERVEDIRRRAAASPTAGDQCIDADAVERLRALRSE